MTPRAVTPLAFVLLAGCGSTAASGAADGSGGRASRDAAIADVGSRPDGVSPDAHHAHDADDRDTVSEAEAEAGDGDSGLLATFFAMTTNTRGTSHLPTVPIGALRLWDTTAVWPLLNTAAGVYDFSELDAWLAEADAAGVDVSSRSAGRPSGPRR
jgi:hypothetical protein